MKNKRYLFLLMILCSSLCAVEQITINLQSVENAYTINVYPKKVELYRSNIFLQSALFSQEKFDSLKSIIRQIKPFPFDGNVADGFILKIQYENRTIMCNSCTINNENSVQQIQLWEKMLRFYELLCNEMVVPQRKEDSVQIVLFEQSIDLAKINFEKQKNAGYYHKYPKNRQEDSLYIVVSNSILDSLRKSFYMLPHPQPEKKESH